MSGGGQSTNASGQGTGQGVATNAAQTAMAGGTAGSAGGAAAAAQQNIPQWQKGLLGAVTGSPQYGTNAPAIHQLLQGAMQQQGAAQPRPAGGMGAQPGMMQRPPGIPPQGMPSQGNPMMQAGMAAQQPQGMPPQGMPQQPGMQGAPQQPGMTPQGLAQGGLSPQMLAQLQQQYPQFFAQKPPGM